MKISVALCTYNGEKFIKEQLESILNQTVSVDEIIICDDNSKDKTMSICQEILSESGKEYKIIVNEASLGVAENFLKALKLTTGDYVFTCDQDDVWHSDKVEIFLRAANETKKDLYFSNGILVNGEGNSLGSTLWEAYLIDFNEISQQPLLKRILKSPVVTGAAMMVSKKLIEQIDTIPKVFLHDEWFSIVAAINNSAQAINVATFDYRQHDKNVVGAKKQSFAKKIKVWLGNYKKLQEIHQTYFLRSNSVYEISKDTRYEPLALQYKFFWETLVNTHKNNRIKNALALIKFFINGKYSSFYTGFRGFIRDLIYVLFLEDRS